SQKLVVLQSLDSLYNIPKTYEETIGAANKDLGKQLVQKVIQDGFMPVGDLLIRQTVGPDGQPQQQILPNYTIYGYEGPKQLPKVKDSDGKEWDLSNFNALAADGGPSTAELQQMVKLAISVLDKDFKKTYDPVNQENREEKIAALDPMAMAKVMQAAQGSLRSLLSDPKYMMASASDKKLMEQSAMSSGYLVGSTEGGVFGDWHFNQFYTPLKLKEKYDQMKAEGESLKSDGFASAVGDTVAFAVQITPLGYVVDTKALSNTVSKAYHDNKEVVDAITAVAAIVGAPFTGGASLIAFAAYKSVQGAYEGGVLGAVAGAANVGNAYLQGLTAGAVSYEMSYSYKDGFGVSVGGGYGKAGIGVGGSISWNAKTGDISGSIGLQTTLGSSGRLTGNVGMSFDKNGFTGVDAGIGIGLGTKTNGNYAAALNLGLSYDKNAGFGQSAGFSENTNKYLPQSSLDYSHTAFGGNTYSVTTPSVAGMTGTLSYNDISQGYTTSLNANGATALTYDSISGDAVYNKNFFGDVGKAQALSLGGMTEEEYKDHVKNQSKLREESLGLWEGTLGIVGSAWDGIKSGAQSLWNGAGYMLGWGDSTGHTIYGDVGNYVSEKWTEKVKPKLNALGEGIQSAWNGTVDAVTNAAKYVTGFSEGGYWERRSNEETYGVNITNKELAGSMDQFTKDWSRKSCFVAGTLVHVPGGYKAIDQIKMGDHVLSWNERTGEYKYKEVSELFVHDVVELFDLEVNGEESFQVTGNHPFWVVDKNAWIEVKDLSVGDTLLLHDRSRVPVTGLRQYHVEPTKVYNLEVEDTHTYAVGENGVVVHNYQIGFMEGILGTINGWFGKPAPFLDNHEQLALAAGYESNMSEAEINALKEGIRNPDVPASGLFTALVIGLQHAGLGFLVDGTETYKSHFGEDQWKHSMASKKGQTNEEAVTDMKNGLKNLYEKANDPNISYLDRVKILGEILHTVTDAFALGHVARNEKGEIYQVQDYTNQDSTLHGGPDKAPPDVAPGTTSALDASKEMIRMWQAGKSWEKVSEYLDSNVYNIADGRRDAITGSTKDYQKAESVPWTLPSWMERPNNGWAPVH
ncbi:polymorphic toxin-type HINT domain-containing protein, partial [Leptospira koniambonensis]|uniref:polymorphic toxin-type HINT domain-containing protein n=1 Tax=Leptospira koniambonensis TaxID=2484950 RepID=UPI00244981E4